MAAKITGAIRAAAGDVPAVVATDIDCDECGNPMKNRSSRGRKFLSRSGYPKCKNTMEVPARLLEEQGVDGNGQAHGKGGKDAKGSGPKAKAPAQPEESETDLLVE